MKPAAIGMTTRSEPRDVISLGILQRVNTYGCQELKERFRKNAAPSSHKVSTSVTGAALSTALLNV